MSWEDILARLEGATEARVSITKQDDQVGDNPTPIIYGAGRNDTIGLMEWQPYGLLGITAFPFLLSNKRQSLMPTVPYGYYEEVDGDTLGAPQADALAAGLNRLWLVLSDFFGQASFLSPTDFNATIIPGSLALSVSPGVLLSGAYPTWMMTRSDANVVLDNSSIDDGDITPSTTNYFFKNKDGRWHVRTTNTPPSGSTIAFSAVFGASDATSANQLPTGRINLSTISSILAEIIAARGSLGSIDARLDVSHNNDGTLVNRVVTPAKIQRAIRSISANSAVTTADEFILVDTTTGNKTVTLPAASGWDGPAVRIKKISSDANQVIVARTGADTIEGVAGSYSFTTQNEFHAFQSDGVSAWRLF